MVKSVVKHIFDCFFLFPNRPKFARLKGFRRLAPINVRNAVYAPKAGALPIALHLELQSYNIIQAKSNFVKLFCIEKLIPANNFS